jgi:polyisoprenoid-binding protein YceI
MKKQILIFATLLTLLACSESGPPAEGGGAAAEAAAPRTDTAAPAPEPVNIQAPASEYRLDPHHSSLLFSVTHLGLSNYVMRFSDFDVALDLKPDDLPASSVTVTIDPTSVATDFEGDYQKTHPDSPFETWEQDLAQSPKFLNAGEYPTISFESRRVTPTDKGTLLVEGDLELLGKTRPVTLEAEVVGAMAQHPMQGVGALGFSAEGSFKRSDFGMTHLLEPPLVGDTVTVRFEGELLQATPETPETPETGEY